MQFKDSIICKIVIHFLFMKKYIADFECKIRNVLIAINTRSHATRDYLIATRHEMAPKT